jgi:proteasome lid subunit RPN8/RPN11
VGEVKSDELNMREWPGPTSQREARFQVIVRQSVLNDVHAHAHSSLNAEICGVLVGDVVLDDRGPFVYVEASIRGEFAASQIAGVTFTAETWTYMQGILDKEHPGKRIVGWYHSHPDFGVFLSEMDLFIHRHFFNLPWQVALVYDPIRSDEGMFVWRSGTPTREASAVEGDAKIVEYKPAAVSAPQGAGESPRQNPDSVEVLRLRKKVKCLSAGVVLALVVSVVWPVVLIIASQRTPWARDIIRSLQWSDTPAKTGPDQRGRQGIQSDEHRNAMEHKASGRPASSQELPGPAIMPVTHGGTSSSTMPAAKGPLSDE